MYPPCCGICGKLNKNSLCKKCEIKLNKLAVWKIEDYRQITSYFEEHIYIFNYDSIIRKTILDYKFNEKSYIYRTFINFLKKNEKICVQIKKYDIIIPVPISLKRKKERGYNQSDLIAKDLALELNIKYIKNALLKIKNNSAQSTLTAEEREKNVKDVYKIKKNMIHKLYEKNILLIDDIFTTGSTVNECSRVLKEAGVYKIGVLTIAK